MTEPSSVAEVCDTLRENLKSIADYLFSRSGQFGEKSAQHKLLWNLVTQIEAMKMMTKMISENNNPLGSTAALSVLCQNAIPCWTDLDRTWRKNRRETADQSQCTKKRLFDLWSRALQMCGKLVGQYETQ
jgi:hypothetical protein